MKYEKSYCVCKGCRARFPFSWITNGGGAVKIGFDTFCSQMCLERHTAQNQQVSGQFILTETAHVEQLKLI